MPNQLWFLMIKCEFSICMKEIHIFIPKRVSTVPLLNSLIKAKNICVTGWTGEVMSPYPAAA